MFGPRDAAFFIESLLKTSAREVHLVGNVPGWPNALMVSQPSVPDSRGDALYNDRHPLWLLDFIPPTHGSVVPQKIWSPPNQSDWRRYVEQATLRMPVFFVQNNGIIGLPLPRAAVGDTASLRRADQPAPLGGGHSTQIRIAVRFLAAVLPPLSPSSVSGSDGFRPPPSPVSGLDMNHGNVRSKLGIKPVTAMKSRWNDLRSSLRASLIGLSL
jgi:hypothetical protein